MKEPLRSIGESAFARCDNLRKVTIPGTVVEISNGAFSDCDNLNDFYNLARVPQDIFDRKVFALSAVSQAGGVRVHVYEDLYEKFSTKLGWYDIGTDYNSNCTIVADIKKIVATSIRTDKTDYYCEIGGEGKALVVFSPSNTSIRDVEWSVNDDAVLFINEKTGEYIGLDEGTATITARTTDGSNLAASATVHILPSGVDGVSGSGYPRRIYDIKGYELKSPHKGLNIINGKKVVL